MTSEPSPDIDITVICAWCRRILRSGGPDVSHGICDDCLPGVLKTVLEQMADTGDEPSPSQDKPG